MPIAEAPNGAAAACDPSFVQRGNNLIQRQVRLLGKQG